MGIIKKKQKTEFSTKSFHFLYKHIVTKQLPWGSSALQVLKLGKVSFSIIFWLTVSIAGLIQQAQVTGETLQSYYT